MDCHYSRVVFDFGRYELDELLFVGFCLFLDGCITNFPHIDADVILKYTGLSSFKDEVNVLLARLGQLARIACGVPAFYLICRACTHLKYF